ncbi:MAG: hypothetical protein QXX41_06320 [Nitrososphaerota archaeon]
MTSIGIGDIIPVDNIKIKVISKKRLSNRDFYMTGLTHLKGIYLYYDAKTGLLWSLCQTMRYWKNLLILG